MSINNIICGVLGVLIIMASIAYAVCVQEGIIGLGEFHIKKKKEEIPKGEEVIRKISFEDGTTFELSEPITLDKERLYTCGYYYITRRIMEAFSEGIKAKRIEE